MQIRNLSVLLLILFLFGCEEPLREEVISRYPGGAKEVVVAYRGSGSDEVLVERRTFNEEGILIQLENVENGTKIGWLEIHKDTLDTPDGLKDALLGDWYATMRYENVPGYGSEVEYRTTIGPGTYERETRFRTFTPSDPDPDWSTSVSTGEIEFLPNRTILRSPDDKGGTEYPMQRYRTVVEFVDIDEIITHRTILVDDRLEVGPLTYFSEYRDKNAADKNPATAEDGERFNEQSLRHWRAAAGGDEVLRTQFPDYYEKQTGFDPEFSKEQLAANYTAEGGYCLTIGPVTSLEFGIVESFASRANLRFNGREDMVSVFAAHWVKVPNVANRESGNMILQKLRDGGLDDANVITEDDGTYSVSLGLYGGREKAERIMQQARSAGVAAEVVRDMRPRDVTYVDLLIPAGLNIEKLTNTFTDDSMLKDESATCPD